MRIGVVITMYDEHDIVLSSITNIRKEFKDAVIIVSHSEDGGDMDSIENAADGVITYDDLSKHYSRYEYPSRSICRNIGGGFKLLYTLDEYDLIVCFTGDTHITDATSFNRIYNRMKEEHKLAYVSQAIGQIFHAPDSDPENDNMIGRWQYDNTTDFACCLFFIQGCFGRETNVFSNIDITNRFTSEQCLGDELIKHTSFENVGRLNHKDPHNSYSYNDGIVYHAKNGKPSR